MGCENRLLGKGKVYFDAQDASGNPTGERRLGNCPEFNLAIESESKEHYSSETAVETKDCEVVTRITRTANIVCDHFNRENIALFLLGEIAQLAQSSGSVTDESLAGVNTDRYYQLGVSAGFPAGARSISNVVVTDDPSTTTYVDGTDYTVDLVTGRLYIIAGGGISDGDDILVDYDTAAVNWEEITSSANASVSGTLRFVADNASGTNNDYYFPSVTVKPSGDLGLITDDYGSMGFEIEVLTPTDGSAYYIDGRPAA